MWEKFFHNLIHAMITQLSQIVQEARKAGPRRLAVAYGQDLHTIQAVYEAYREGLVTPTLYGDKEQIAEICRKESFEISAFNIVDVKNDVQSVKQAVTAVATGQADVLMKGLVSTDKYMRGILDKEAGLFPHGGVLSHLTVLEMPDYPRLILFSDAAVIPQPDFKQKIKIFGYLRETANVLGLDCPKIALIAPSEQVLPTVESSTDAAVIAKMADRGQLGQVVADGPLSLDVALYPHVAEEKKVKGSSVAGMADCLLFTNIESANVFFKSASHFGGAQLAAMVVGTKVPCVLTSRGDTPQTKLYSIALSCLAAK